MDGYNGGYRRGPPGGRGRGHRDRSFSPPMQRGSPDYGPHHGPSHGGRGGGGPSRGPPRRDDGPDFRDKRGPPFRGGDDRPRGRPDYGRPSYDRGPDNHGGPPGPGGRHGGRDYDSRDSYRDRGDFPRGGDRGGHDGYDRGHGRGGRDWPPSPDYHGDGPDYRRGGRDSPEGDGRPLSKVMFIKKYIEEDLSEKEIDERYTDYLATIFKSKNKAEFERQKNEDDFKRRFDPFVFKEEVEGRAKVAQTTAVTFAKAYADGKYDWTAEGKQQLLLPSDFKKAASTKIPTPVISWLPEIIHCCWRVAGRLITKLDEEKGVRHDELFDWIEALPAARKEAADADGGDDMDEDARDAEDDKEGGKEDGALTVEDLLKSEAPEGEDLTTKTGQLDVMLEYLWQVHGLDFYSGEGGELSVELYKTVKERLKRTPPDIEFRAVRIAKPQSGNLVDDRKRDQVIDEFHHIVTKPWIERLKRVDADTQKALDLDAQLEAAVDIAIQNMVAKAKQEDKSQVSYKCTFGGCGKKFKGEEYLKKHIVNKHEQDFEDYKDAERQKAREELFFESFENHAKKEHDGDHGGDPVMEGGGPGGPMPPPMAYMPMPMQPGFINPMMYGMMPHMGMMMDGMGGPFMGGRGRGGPMGAMMGGMGGGRGRGRGRRGPPAYYDFDAPANQREQLNYGDI